ncbi:helix-turn-helix domain-containing protein [Mammaliicoccus sp. Dog046]|uniref:helix-turn-helix domain-containing protein n=1 Tax=Mammaliicoccus sp. Dog046 TaxID=3034233 RepID=UPI002B2567A9|nr:helix-turn-helix domain-containing protein [Mammaliicoccus sp. Dog046]WQK85802.1 helix-turn-helix domain-containing protein [Mammaliicoccus sp. Dog046]
MYNYEISLHQEGIINPKKIGFGALCFILEGDVELTLNHVKQTFSVGDLFYLQDSDNYLPLINNGMVAILHISYSMMESMSNEEAFLFRIPSTSKSNHLDRYKHQIKDLFIKAILADLTKVKIRSSLYVMEIFKVLYERFKVDVKHYGQMELDLSSLIYKVKQYIDQNFHDTLSLNIVASHFYVSPEHLSREFSKQMAKTFIQYLKETRLYQATYALLFSQFTVEQIANSHGFSSYHNFNRQFKAQFNVTPKQYRLQYKQNKVNKHDISLSTEEKSSLISKLQKMMHNKSLVHEYKYMSFTDKPLRTINADHKTYLHIGGVHDFHTPFLGEIINNLEKIPTKPVIVIHCSMKSFYDKEHGTQYKHDLAYCLSIFTNTKIKPALKIHDIEPTDNIYNQRWYELIDVIHNYFYNKSGEIFFDINFKELIHLNSQIKATKERLPDVKIMINAPDPFEYNYEDLNINLSELHDIDGFALSYNFNDLYQLEKMNNYDITRVTNAYTKKLIKNMKYLNLHNKDVIPIEWNVINGNSITTSDYYFNASIMLNHLLDISSYITGTGYWLMEEAATSYSTISRPLSLYLKYHCKSPTNYLLTLLTDFNGQTFYAGPNYVKFEIHNKIYYLLFNYELYHPHDINYQNNIGIILSFRDIPFEQFRVTKITFDQDNGNIFKAIRKLDDNQSNLDYLNTVLLDRYCSPDIEMADFNTRQIEETYYLKTNGIKLLIVQNLK